MKLKPSQILLPMKLDPLNYHHMYYVMQSQLPAVSKKPDMSADTPVRGQGCLQTGVSADRGVCGQVFRIDKQFVMLYVVSVFVFAFSYFFHLEKNNKRPGQACMQIEVGCLWTPLPANTPVRGHPCLRTPLSADRGVRGHVGLLGDCPTSLLFSYDDASRGSDYQDVTLS